MTSLTKKMTLSIMFVILLVAAPYAHAASYICPPLIDEEPRTAKPLNGFEGWDFKEEEDEDHVLTEVSLYSGHPKEMASLAPDNKGGKAPWVWSNPKNGANYWLMCRYDRTRLTYIRKLDTFSKSCSVIQDKKTKKPSGLECQ